MKYLIAGLGNIGAEYQNTRHNIGFDILERLASMKEVSFESGRYAFNTLVKHKGRSFYLIKPTTYMNLSGKAVNYWLQSLKIPQQNLLVVTDDLNLPTGKMRLRAKGSDGGHNGLKHIQETLGNSAYPRLRFGVGNDFGSGQQVNFVLGKWAQEEETLIKERIDLAVNAILEFGTQGLPRTMTKYNGI